MQNTKFTRCKNQDDLESQVQSWAQSKGKEVRKKIAYTKGKNWQDYAGKKFSVRVKGNIDGSVNIKDFDSGDSHFFCLENHDFKEKKTYTKPETKSCLTEFNKLPSAKPNHPYLTKKNISIENLNIKQEGNNLVIPVFSKTGDIISWQSITPEGDKIFKPGHTLGQGYYFPIGAHTKKIYVAEGIATGATINEKTQCQVYCAFSKHNLDNVTQDILNKYKDKKIILALDNDAENTLKTKIKDKRLTIICPEKKGDFNDFQNIEKEILKLKTLKSFSIFSVNSKFIQEKKQEQWIIKAWIPARGIILLTADKGTGKSMVGFLFIKIFTQAIAETIFGCETGGHKPWLYLYIEGTEEVHRDRWQAMGGDPSKLVFWKYNPDDKNTWNDLNNLEAVISTGHYGGVFADRADMFVNQDTKRSVRDTLIRLENLFIKYNMLCILSRHTSKGQGRDARNFKERTDGFKEWQHTPRVCLFVHKTDSGAVVFKQYANDCSTDNLIHFDWHSDNDLKISVLKFKELELISQQAIEERYNPFAIKQSKSEKIKKDFTIVFKKYATVRLALKAGYPEKRKVYALDSENRAKFLKDIGLTSKPALQKLQEDYDGFYRDLGCNGTVWYLPKLD